MRGTRYEVSSVAFDPALQAVGNDLDCSPYNVGVQIPATPPTSGIDCKRRWVFMLARTSIRVGQKTRLVGLRQLVTIRAQVTHPVSLCTYPLELEVRSPFWHFVDGSVSWHLRRIPVSTNLGTPALGTESFGFGDSQTPAVIGQNVAGFDGPGFYRAPSSLPGEPILGDLGTFYGIRWPWLESSAQFSLDYEIEGPCDIALFATVLQTTPGTRCVLSLPAAMPAGTTSLPDEDAFVVNFPAAVYGRIAGAMVFEEAGKNPCP